jgi:hypothetical protein
VFNSCTTAITSTKQHKQQHKHNTQLDKLSPRQTCSGRSGCCWLELPKNAEQYIKGKEKR